MDSSTRGNLCSHSTSTAAGLCRLDRLPCVSHLDGEHNSQGLRRDGIKSQMVAETSHDGEAGARLYALVAQVYFRQDPHALFTPSPRRLSRFHLVVQRKERGTVREMANSGEAGRAARDGLSRDEIRRRTQQRFKMAARQLAAQQEEVRRVVRPVVLYPPCLDRHLGNGYHMLGRTTVAPLIKETGRGPCSELQTSAAHWERNLHRQTTDRWVTSRPP